MCTTNLMHWQFFIVLMVGLDVLTIKVQSCTVNKNAFCWCGFCVGKIIKKNEFHMTLADRIDRLGWSFFACEPLLLHFLILMGCLVLLIWSLFKKFIFVPWRLEGIQAWSLEGISNTITQRKVKLNLKGSSRFKAEGISTWTSLCGRQSVWSSQHSYQSSLIANRYYLEGSSSVIWFLFCILYELADWIDSLI